MNGYVSPPNERTSDKNHILLKFDAVSEEDRKTPKSLSTKNQKICMDRSINRFLFETRSFMNILI